MGVAAHLGIDLREYDARIRTFIPDYGAMLDAAASAVPAGARRIVDLGIGTGALAARCLARAKRARVTGIDVDPQILEVAARRLAGRSDFLVGNFARMPIPRADAVVASFALHHVRTRAAKGRLYARVTAALGRRGQFITVDCHPSADRRLAAAQRDAWRTHLRRTYSPAKAEMFLRMWSKEDVYLPLGAEVELMRRSGLRAEVLWRKDAFAVIRAVAG